MINLFCARDGRIERTTTLQAKDGALWIDLHNPSDEEEKQIEQWLGIDIPTKEEMSGIELSSRLYEQKGALYMTAEILSRVDQENPQAESVTFVLTDNQLITVRYHDPKPFATFYENMPNLPRDQQRPELILIGLLEAIIGRLADILEWVGQDIDKVSRLLFRSPGAQNTSKPNYDLVLQQVGHQGDRTFRARESLATLNRMLNYMEQSCKNDPQHHREMSERLETVTKDVAAIGDYAMFISGNISFLLDATLGIIGIDQNTAIKIFTIVGTVLMPPTLVASIYGMNFEHMPPEIHAHWGFPYALCLMIISGLVPYLYFKKKGWL